MATRTAVAAPTPTAGAAETPTIPKVKVKVSTNAESGVVITSTHPPGTAENIAQFFNSSKLSRRVETYVIQGYGLRDIIRKVGTKIPADIWAQAIAAEIISRIGANTVGEVEMNTVGAGGYLALDNGVYKLVAVECAPINKAMSVIRRRMIDKTTIETSRMLTTAQLQAASITTRAGELMADARRLQEEIRAAGLSAPPRWTTAAKVPIKFENNWWHVGFVMKMQFLRFEYAFHPGVGRTMFTRKAWPAMEHKPVRTLFWLPIPDPSTGIYSSREIRVDRNFCLIPHVNYEGSCMALEQIPRAISSLDHFLMLQHSFARCMRTVNLASILSWAPYWDPQLQAAIPTAIRQIVMAAMTNDITELRAETIVAPEQSTMPTVEAATETWTAQIA